MTQLVKAQDRANSIRALLDKHRGQIAMALPKHLPVDRLIRVALTAINKTPMLLEADQRSLFAAVIQAAQLGLEPDGALGQAWLIPYRNRKKGTVEVQFQPGYRGLLSLVRRSGELSTIEVRSVFAKDFFRFQYGINPVLEHTPWDPGAAADRARYHDDIDYAHAMNPGELVAVYAIAKLKDSGVQWDVMRRHEVDAIRARSQSREAGPWVTDFSEMAKKTVLKRLCKLLPMSVEAATAMHLDDKAESGEPQDLELPTSVQTDDDEPPAGSALEQLTATIKAGTPPPPQPPDVPHEPPPGHPPMDDPGVPPVSEIPFDLGGSELPPDAPERKKRGK
jgi:recombination protein RecT